MNKWLVLIAIAAGCRAAARGTEAPRR